MLRSSIGAALVLGVTLAPTAAAADTAANGTADEPATLSGIRFMDRNGDGVHQTEEPGSYAYPVYLEKPSGERVDQAEFTDDGRYVMKGIAPGDYVLVFPLGDFVETTPRKVPVHVDAGQWKVVDNGVRGGEVSGMAWRDANGDGQRQEGEPPLPGVRVDLKTPGNAGYTGEDGTYHFYDLPIMDHQVHFGTGQGMPFSPPLVGEGATDSDVIDADEGRAEAHIHIGKGGELHNALNIDAGYVPES